MTLPGRRKVSVVAVFMCAPDWRSGVIEPQMNADKRRYSFGQEFREDYPFEIEAARFSEVQQITQWLLGDAQVVQKLGLMLSKQLAHGFKLDDKASEDGEVGM